MSGNHNEFVHLVVAGLATCPFKRNLRVHGSWWLKWCEMLGGPGRTPLKINQFIFLKIYSCWTSLFLETLNLSYELLVTERSRCLPFFGISMLEMSLHPDWMKSCPLDPCLTKAWVWKWSDRTTQCGLFCGRVVSQMHQRNNIWEKLLVISSELVWLSEAVKPYFFLEQEFKQERLLPCQITLMILLQLLLQGATSEVVNKIMLSNIFY